MHHALGYTFYQQPELSAEQLHIDHWIENFCKLASCSFP